MLRRSRALEERLRSRQAPAIPASVQQQIPRTAIVPMSALTPAAHLVVTFLEARHVVSDPLESQVSSILLKQVESEASWYQTRAASKVASDLQQSSAMNIIFQAVEVADPRRDDKDAEW